MSDHQCFSRSLSALALAVALILLLAACGPPAQGPAGAAGAGQTLENKGSDTMVNLALAWAERYGSEHPEARLSVTGGGSGTGIAALINGTVDIANASRAIKGKEIENARANGVEPVEFVVARDAIAIIVNLDNPVNELSLEQLSAMYRGEVTNWEQVGGENRPIVLLSRETNSGTHVFFLEQVVRLGQKDSKELFSPATLLLPSSEGITAEVKQNPNAIGYDGLGYVTDAVKVIAVARDLAGPHVYPSAETVNNKQYPIARDLYMYTAGEPSGLAEQYLAWILDPEAQHIVADLGFVPVK